MKIEMKPPVLCALLLAVASCSPAQDRETDTKDAAQEAPSNRIEISSTVQRNLGITFAKVEARRVAQTLRVPGAFEIQPLARHEYRMALAGRVELLVDQYEEVEAGQTLFRFKSPE